MTAFFTPFQKWTFILGLYDFIKSLLLVVISFWLFLFFSPLKQFTSRHILECKTNSRYLGSWCSSVLFQFWDTRGYCNCTEICWSFNCSSEGVWPRNPTVQCRHCVGCVYGFFLFVFCFFLLPSLTDWLIVWKEGILSGFCCRKWIPVAQMLLSSGSTDTRYTCICKVLKVDLSVHHLLFSQYVC